MKTQLVFSARLAKILIRNRYRVADIEPNASNKDRTIFYFEEAPGLIDEICSYIDNQRIKTKALNCM